MTGKKKIKHILLEWWFSDDESHGRKNSSIKCKLELCVGFCLPPSDRSEKSGDILLGSICQPHVQNFANNWWCFLYGTELSQLVPRSLAFNTINFGMLGCRKSAKQPGGPWFLEHPKVYYIPNYSMTRCGYFILGRGIEKNPTRYRILICLPSKKLGFTHLPITVTTKMITFLFGPEIPTTTFICHWHVVIGGTPSRKNNMENPFFLLTKLTTSSNGCPFHVFPHGKNIHLQMMFPSMFN